MSIMSPAQLLESSERKYNQIKSVLIASINKALSQVILQPDQTSVKIEIEKPLCNLCCVDIQALVESLLAEAGYSNAKVKVPYSFDCITITLTIH